MLWVVASFFLPLAVQAEQITQAEQARENDVAGSAPSRELLEFLADFGDVDDEEFELMVFHGKQDVNESDEKAEQKDGVDESKQQHPQAGEYSDEN